MRDNGNISEYRDKLDQTLSSHDLVNDDLLKNLVKNQMLRSSECGLQGLFYVTLNLDVTLIGSHVILKPVSSNKYLSNEAYRHPPHPSFFGRM